MPEFILDTDGAVAAENARLRAALEAIAAIEARTKSDHIGALKHARHIAKCSTAESAPLGRHIGGSILPSNEPRILQAVETPFGVLQVRAIAELDTHGLFHRHARGESLLATHGNGYSCHSLLERLVAGDVDRVREQVEYILDCGGTARSVDHILNLVTP